MEETCEVHVWDCPLYDKGVHDPSPNFRKRYTKFNLRDDASTSWPLTIDGRRRIVDNVEIIEGRRIAYIVAIKQVYNMGYII